MTLAHGALYSLIRDREPFKAGNVYAEVVNGIYAVYSYGGHFPLAVWCNGRWFVNQDKYSASTSRQQSRTGVRGLPSAAFTVTDDLTGMIRCGSPQWNDQQKVERVTRALMREPEYA